MFRRHRARAAIKRFESGLADLRAGRVDDARRQLALALPGLEARDGRALYARFIILDHPERFPICDREREVRDVDWQLLIRDVAASPHDLESLLVSCRAGRAGMNLVCGLTDEAPGVFEATAAWRRQNSPSAARSSLSTAYGYCMAFVAAGQVDAAARFVDEAAAQFAATSEPATMTSVTMMKTQLLAAFGLALDGRVAEAAARAEAALRLHQRLPHPQSEMTWTWLVRPVLIGALFYRDTLPPVYELRYSAGAWWQWIDRMRHTADLPAATDFVIEYLTEFAQLLSSSLAPIARQDMGALLVLSGRSDDGVSVLHDAWRAADQAEPTSARPIAHDLAAAYRYLEDAHNALHWLDIALEGETAAPRRGGVLHERAAAYAALGRVDQAVADYEVAHRLHLELGRLGDAADCEHNLNALRPGRNAAGDGTLFRSGGPDSAWPELTQTDRSA